jgi:hypothetical protein
MFNFKLNENRFAIMNRIHRSDGKFVTVTFPKKDGTIRKMTVKRVSLERFVNPNASESGKQAAETRDRNNPNLIRVFESHNHGQPRTVDLDKVLSIKCNGVTEHVLRYGDDIAFEKEVA